MEEAVFLGKQLSELVALLLEIVSCFEFFLEVLLFYFGLFVFGLLKLLLLVKDHASDVLLAGVLPLFAD